MFERIPGPIRCRVRICAQWWRRGDFIRTLRRGVAAKPIDFIQADRHAVFLATVVESGPHFAVIQIDGLDKGIYQFCLILLVRYVPGPERFKPELYFVLWNVHQRGPLDRYCCLQAPPVILQLHQPILGGGGDDALLDSGHHILNGLFDPLHLLLRRQQHGVLAVELQEIIVAVHQPLDNLVPHEIFLGDLGYLLLDPVPADCFLLAVLFQTFLLADVVIVLVLGLAGARYADHRRAAMPTKQLASQQIVAVLPVSALGVLFGL